MEDYGLKPLMDMLENTSQELREVQKLQKQINEQLTYVEPGQTESQDRRNIRTKVLDPGIETGVTIKPTKIDERDSLSTEPNFEDKANEQTVKWKGKEGTVLERTVSKAKSKSIKGFVETMNLKFDHVLYGSQLKRHVVDMNQDNRLCFRFGLEANRGETTSQIKSTDEMFHKQSRNPTGVRRKARESRTSDEKVGHRDKVSYQKSQPNIQQGPVPEGRQGQRSNESHRVTKDRDHTLDHKFNSRTQGSSATGQGQWEGKGHVLGKGEGEGEGHYRSQGHLKSSKQPKQMQKIERKPSKENQQSQRQTGQNITVVATPTPESEAAENPLAIFQKFIANMGSENHLSTEERRAAEEFLQTEGNNLLQSEELQQIQQELDSEDISEDEVIAGIAEMWKAAGIDFGLSEEETHSVIKMSMSIFSNERGKFDTRKTIQFAMKFWPDVLKNQMQMTDADSSSDTDKPIEEHPQLNDDRMEQREAGHAEVCDGNTQEEHLIVDRQQWYHYATEEIDKGKVANDVRERGMDTLFCLDMSASMKANGWDEAVNFIRKFIEGLQNTTLMDGVYEHVALITFGNETRVQQHLTCDYFEILRKLDLLKPGGTSPMYAGLQMTHAASLAAGTMFRYKGYIMPPRVFLITDGKVTPAEFAAGPDSCTAEEAEQEHVNIRRIVKQIYDRNNITFNAVPVGRPEMGLLQKIAVVSKGKIVSPRDWDIQSRAFKNYIKASSAGIFRAPELARMFLEYRFPDVPAEDKLQMDEFLRSHRYVGDDGDEEDKNLPPLGTRVQLCLQENKIIRQSGSDVGTITKHLQRGHVEVTWDEPREDGSICQIVPYEGGQGALEVVDSPRVLVNEMIAEGCRVKRGKDWDPSHGDQDGGAGNYGTVYGVFEDGIVNVRWDKGGKYWYRFGMEGKFELEILGQNSQDAETEEEDTGPKAVLESESEAERIRKMNERNVSQSSGDGQREESNSRISESSSSASTGKLQFSVPTPDAAGVLPHGFRNTTEGDAISFDGTERSSADGAGLHQPVRDRNISPDLKTALDKSRISSTGLKDSSSSQSIGEAGDRVPLRDCASSLVQSYTESSSLCRANHEHDSNYCGVFVSNDSFFGQVGKSLTVSETIKNKNMAAVCGERTGSESKPCMDHIGAFKQFTERPNSESNGTRSKTIRRLNTVETQESKAQWMWQDGDSWILYSTETNAKIENDFRRNPEGTSVVRHNNCQFRLVFSKMEQINTATREKQTIRRDTL